MCEDRGQPGTVKVPIGFNADPDPAFVCQCGFRSRSIPELGSQTNADSYLGPGQTSKTQ